MGAVSLLSLAVTPAAAQCVVNGTPAASGTAGADTILCDAANSPATTLNTLDGNDELTIDGAVTSSEIDLGLGDDTLTFRSGTTNAIIRMNAGNDTVIIYDDANFLGGINPGTEDTTLIFRTAVAQTLDGNFLSNFDRLIKEDAGTLTNTGIFPLLYTNGVSLNGGALRVSYYIGGPNLDMADDTTLIVDGGFGSTSPGGTTMLTGSSGVNNITVTDANTFPFQNGLYATGDLGDGADLLTTAGIVNTGAGVLSLGLGDDVFTVNGGADVTGVIGGGDGDDQVNADIAAAATGTVDRVTDFETLTKTGAGTLVVEGAGASNIGTVNINAGMLNVAAGGSIIDVGTATVASGATIDLAGAFSFTTGTDTFDVSGALTGAGAFDLLDGDDTLTLGDGADLSGLTSAIDGGAGNDQLNADISTSAIFGAAAGFETLTKTGAGVLNVVGPAGSSFDVVNVNAGTLDIDAASSITNVNVATVLGGATLNADGAFGFTTGADTLTVIGTISGASAIDLGAGDDTFTFQEGAVTSAPVDGGTGTDTLNANILTTGALAQATNFETLTKTGAGTLNIAGAAVSDFSTVNVNEGTLDLAAAGSITTVNAATVASGATLDADGAFGFTTGTDTFDVAGVVTGAGTFDMLGGDDTLTLRDGADLSGLTDAIDGNLGSDTVLVDNAAALAFNGSQVANFETLQKDNTGVLTLAGAQSYSVATALNGGTLDVSGTLETPTVTMADGTTLSVDGTAQANGSAQAVINGSTGVNTVTVNSGATLLATADLGDGADRLTVSGTLNAGGGVFALGAGNDTFTINDGTTVIGTVDGGTGSDVFNPNINTAATLGTVQGFETLTKTGGGVLNLTGPGASSFNTVNVNGGTVDVAAAGSITGVNAATVAAGATLDVDGTFDFTAGANTFDIAGAVTGASGFDMLNGDDTLTLSDGANLSGLAASIDGNLGSDTVLVDNAAAFTFDGSQVTNFETLQKDNTGALTLAGAQSYSVATALNGGTLDVDGTLETPIVTMADGTTLNVDGTAQASGSAQAAITGSTGINTVAVNSGATLLATANLGDGADVLTVSGALDAGGGVFALGAGNDTFTIDDGATVNGTVDAGAGADTINTNIASSANLGASIGFETLTKTGAGVLNVVGPAASVFDTVNVNGGTLDIAGGGAITDVSMATVLGGATLDVDGAFDFTTGANTFDIAGTVTGTSGFDMLDGDDTLILREGSDISGVTSPIDGAAGTDTVVVDNVTEQTFDDSNIVDFEILRKENVGTLTLEGMLSFSSGTILNGGLLDVEGSYETPTVAMADGTVLDVGGTLQAAASTQAVFTGSAGANTINVTGTLLASGDLGDGADVLDVFGALDTGADGLALGGGDDTLTIHDGTTITGIVDGGDGADTFNTDINTTADIGAVQGFETLTKTGAGVLNVTGPAASSFDTVNVEAGTLDIAAAGSITNVSAATVVADATFDADGGFLFTPGSDLFDLGGTLAGAGDFDMLEDDDAMIVRAGADISGFTGTIDGGDGTDRVEFYNLVGVLPDAFTSFEEIYLLDDTAADAHMPGDDMRTLDAMLFVGTDSRFTADGNSPGATNIMGDFVNLGVVAMADGGADDVINVSGDYAGGGILEIDAALDATATADLLVIEGNVGAVATTLEGTVESLPTLLSVTDVGTGTGVDTGTGPGAGIAVVDVSATGGTAEGDFVLENPLVAGKYAYDLNLETDGVWYLQSERLEQVAGYSAALPDMIGLMNHTVALGSDSRTARAGRADYFYRDYRDADTGDCEATEAWMRARGGRLRETPEVGSRLRQRYGQLDLGLGRAWEVRDSGCFKLAARGILGLADSEAYDIDEEAGAELDTRYHGAGLSMTLQRDNGFYMDFSGQALRFDTDVSVRDEGVKARMDAWGVSAAVETGLRVALSDVLHVTPRVQFNWNGLYGDDFTDADGAEISFADNEQFSVTTGLIVERTSDANWAGDEAKLAVYGVFDVQYNADRDLSIVSSGEEFEYVGNKIWTRVCAGATLALKRNVSIYGEFSGAGALSGSIRESYGVEGNLGFRVRW